jgi:hypothetical protein
VNGNTPGNQPTSGRIPALACHPTDPNIIYAGPAGGGVWKTTDAGASWTGLTNDQPVLFMGALAVSKSNPNVVYAGTGEATNSLLSFYGAGILKTTNGGTSWTVVGASVFNRRAISRIVIHPTNPDIVYAATAGAVNALTGNRGVFKSTDGGANWTNTTTSITTSGTTTFSDIAMDPVDPETLYCACGLYFGSAQNGVYKTSNGATTWAVAGDFPIGSVNGRITLANAPSDNQVVYAAVIQSASPWNLSKMMKTTNAGVNWTQIPGVPNYAGGQGWYDTVLIVDPSNAGIVYAGGQSGADSFIKSENGGTSWTDIKTGANGNGPHVDHHSASFDANGRLVEGNDGGIVRLDDASLANITWTTLNTNLLATQFIGIAMHPTDPDIAFGGSQDNGTEKFTGSLGWTGVRGGDGGYVRINPTNPLVVYHAFNYPRASGIIERSDNGGTTWAVKHTGINQADAGNFYPPMVMDPSNPNRLLFGTNRVYETTDSAENWTAISAPGANGWPNISNSGIDSIEIAPSSPSTIYATVSGRIVVTTDNGASWTLRGTGFPDHYKDFAIDPTDANTVVVGRDRFGPNGRVFRTTTAGTSWTNITGDLPDFPVNTVAMDVNGAGAADDVIYVGTDVGVYFTTNLGVNWAKYATALPNVLTFELAINPALNILAAGTHGQGMWQILISTIPQINAIANDTETCSVNYVSSTPTLSQGTPTPTWSLLAGPGGMTINPANGVVTWPATVASATPYTVTIQASNPGGNHSQSFQLLVRPGDFNGNGQCEDDVAIFVDHLLGVDASHPCAADADLDGFVNGKDIAAHVLCSLSP